MAALLSPTSRKADLAVITAAPERTTSDARAMGITGLVGAYETFYGGIPNRIHNVQLVAHLIDNHFIAPNEEFSFNGTTGDRSEAKGFLEAPVIINGELKTGLGGGVSPGLDYDVQRGVRSGRLPITDRTNHGSTSATTRRAATRPSTTRTPTSSSSTTRGTGSGWDVRQLVVADGRALRDAQHRQVQSEVTPLVVTGQPPVKRVPDPT